MTAPTFFVFCPSGARVPGGQQSLQQRRPRVSEADGQGEGGGGNNKSIYLARDGPDSQPCGVGQEWQRRYVWIWVWYEAHARSTELCGSTYGAEWTGVAVEGVELINETRRDPLGAFLFGAGLFGLAQGRRHRSDDDAAGPGDLQAGRRAGRALAGGGGGGQAGGQQQQAEYVAAQQGPSANSQQPTARSQHAQVPMPSHACLYTLLTYTHVFAGVGRGYAVLSRV
ncbi:hypothetical protein COCCADRAFT_29705 [Bipolaris zeicola 26-R-13]|uniref:Uncharacterized protein n=1 Tax=Cochliobolus carbonum (strain 26-R-13) TaxID=930089 RepID=W6XU23_COCC2|nr:uncharacterized protein COCCADRAFT_29705 [Bipolaris zeicola 26-R-13]EUC29168.1 hypothetical protein COCCADRAFT_29705 [Bipolaris zeicola 26-R-13]